MGNTDDGPLGKGKGTLLPLEELSQFDDSLKICNSHYLSQFAAFFINARAKRSVAESCICFFDRRPTAKLVDDLDTF